MLMRDTGESDVKGERHEFCKFSAYESDRMGNEKL
jgi:hypothetical protein